MLVKKFKNGNIVLTVEKSDRGEDGKLLERVYHDDLFMSDLYLSEDLETNEFYLVDTNTKMVYNYFGNYSNNCVNALLGFLSTFNLTNKVKLYPLPFDQWIELKMDIWED